MITRLDYWRRRRLGANGLLLLFKKSSTTAYGVLLSNVVDGFFIGREEDTETGELNVYLTIDTTAVLTDAVMKQAIGCDITDGTRTTRYKFKTKTPPPDATKRWICLLTANQTDTTPIV